MGYLDSAFVAKSRLPTRRLLRPICRGTPSETPPKPSVSHAPALSVSSRDLRSPASEASETSEGSEPRHYARGPRPLSCALRFASPSFRLASVHSPTLP